MQKLGIEKKREVIKNASSAIPADLKYENRWRILRVFRDGGEYSANDVAASTGISRQTIMKAIRFFRERDLLESVGKGDSTEIGGKKPEYFSFCRKNYLVCITMWPSTINLTLFDLVRRKLDYVENKITLSEDLSEVFTLLKQLVDAFLERNHIDLDSVYGVGLSTAGVVDYRTGNIRYNHYAPQWGHDIDIKEMIYEIFGNDVMVFVENAGKAIGRAVLLDDESVKQKRVLTIFSSWGLSACMIERGHVLNGKDSIIGEIGRLCLWMGDSKDPQINEKVYLESAIGIQRVRELLVNQQWECESTLTQIDPQELTLCDLFAASAEQDEYAREIVADLARKMALVLHNCTLLFNPDVVIFHGDLSYADSYFDQILQQTIKQMEIFHGEGAFDTVYDKRPVFEMDAIGLSTALANAFFRNDLLYSGAE